jgi:hypothetical protein
MPRRYRAIAAIKWASLGVFSALSECLKSRHKCRPHLWFQRWSERLLTRQMLMAVTSPIETANSDGCGVNASSL